MAVTAAQGARTRLPRLSEGKTEMTERMGEPPSGTGPRGTASEAGQTATSERALMERAIAHQNAGRYAEAEPLYRAILAQRPLSSAAWSNLGVILRSTARYDASVRAHRRAYALARTPTIVNNFANALHDSGRFAEALPLRRALYERSERSVVRLRDYCATLRCLGRHEEAIALLDRAEAEGWLEGEPVLQRSFSHLTLGHYEQGFRDFEARFHGNEVRLPEIGLPRWMGEPIEGRRLLVTPEQGFGDAVMVARFLPRLKAVTGAHVTLWAKKPLRRLFEGVEGADRVVSSTAEAGDCALYTPNMSVPMLVGLEGGTPPPPARLSIPDDSRARARARVGPFEGMLKVGIVWTGSLSYRANHRRAAGLERFLPLAEIPGVQLFSLYKGDAHDTLAASGELGTIVDACGDDRDFADAAGIMDALDLMVTTDTAVVHVAASLGKPVWNLLAYEGFWLYGLGERTPWYPSMRLFRQPEPGDWDSVFAAVGRELRALVAERGATWAGRAGRARA
jgi:hypothetical protein